MKGRKYLSMIKAGIMEDMQFRGAIIMTFLGNLLYLLLAFFLWKAIFESSDSPVINGMTFSDTIIYLVFAATLFNFMEMWTVWNMGRDIQDGKIVVDLLMPCGYRRLRLFRGLGEVIVNFFTTLLPTAIIVYFISGKAIHLGLNILWFLISVFFSFFINYYIEFIVGTIIMYTESIWGIDIMKEVVVGVLSGAMIPLAFFPEGFKQIALALPFHAIIDSPMTLLLHPEYGLTDVVNILAMQVLWFVVMGILSDVFFKFSLRRITVNGG